MFDWLTQDNIENVLVVATSVIGTAAVIATMTPNEADNKVVDLLLKAINFLGANFGKAKNK